MPRKLPPWTMGLANAPLGFTFGFISTAIPFLLASRGVSTAQIAGISAICFSPSFWAFLLCPILDVRFSKRQYCVGCFTLAALCVGCAVLNLDHLALFTALTTFGCASAVIGGNSLAALLIEVVDQNSFGSLGGWVNVANLGAAGIFGTMTIFLVQKAPIAIAALSVALIILAPLLLLTFFPTVPAATRAAAETFSTLFRDLLAVMKRRECILGLIAFLSPGSAFALTNLFSGLGASYQAPENLVAWIGGAGVAIACSIGCLLGGPLADRFPRPQVYVITGIVGATVSVAMLFAPHTTTVFIIGVLAYNLAQGLNYTAFTALSYELTGKDNPLAGTQVALLTASANLPISYMTALDGAGSARHGLTGMYAVDAGASLIACAALLILFRRTAHARLPTGTAVMP